MQDFKQALIERISKQISEFDIEYMYHRMDGYPELDYVFGADVIETIKDDDFLESSCDAAKQGLMERNRQVINAFTDLDETFYCSLVQKLEQSPIYAVSSGEHLDHTELELFLFNMDGELVFFGNVPGG